MIGYSIGVFQKTGNWLKVILMPLLENNLGFIYDFQRHLPETIQVVLLMLQNKLY